ncbi:hypothetical protein TWF173_002059 [Orbilia oligospora]|nr:hypothetical protein TWF173_002059 [Orbilia oligospora]
MASTPAPDPNGPFDNREDYIDFLNKLFPGRLFAGLDFTPAQAYMFRRCSLIREYGPVIETCEICSESGAICRIFPGENRCLPCLMAGTSCSIDGNKCLFYSPSWTIPPQNPLPEWAAIRIEDAILNLRSPLHFKSRATVLSFLCDSTGIKQPHAPDDALRRLQHDLQSAAVEIEEGGFGGSQQLNRYIAAATSKVRDLRRELQQLRRVNVVQDPEPLPKNLL